MKDSGAKLWTWCRPAQDWFTGVGNSQLMGHRNTGAGPVLDGQTDVCIFGCLQPVHLIVWLTDNITNILMVLARKKVPHL